MARVAFSSSRGIINDLLEGYSSDQVGKSGSTKSGSMRGDGYIRTLIRHSSPAALRNYGAILTVISAVVAGNVSVVAGVAIFSIGTVLAFFYLRRRLNRYALLIDRDLAVLLTSLASSLRAGIDPLRALCDADEYLPTDSPFSAEIRNLKQRLSAGDDELEVISQFFINSRNSDVELFKQCMLLARIHGGSLAGPLHRVAKVVRQRQSFRRKTRAALAMHRMSALGIAFCALVVGGMQILMNIKGVRIALASTTGMALLGVGGGLILLGVVWMLKAGTEEKL